MTEAPTPAPTPTPTPAPAEPAPVAAPSPAPASAPVKSLVKKPSAFWERIGLFALIGGAGVLVYSCNFPVAKAPKPVERIVYVPRECPVVSLPPAHNPFKKKPRKPAKPVAPPPPPPAEHHWPNWFEQHTGR